MTIGSKLMSAGREVLNPLSIISFSTGAFQYLGPHSMIGTGIAGGVGIALKTGERLLNYKLTSTPATKAAKLQSKIEKITTPKPTRAEKKIAKAQAKTDKLKAALEGAGKDALSGAEAALGVGQAPPAPVGERHP